MSYIKILLLTALVHFCALLSAQIDTAAMSHREVLLSKKLKTWESYDELQNRFTEAVATKDLAQQFELAKYLARAAYRGSKTQEIKKWQETVDSLSQYLVEIPFDQHYEMVKISWAVTSKETSAAMKLLKEIEPKVFATNDTVWMIDYHIQCVMAYATFDDMATALKHLLEAEQLNDSFKGREQEGFIYSGRATIAWENRESEESLEFEMKAAQVYEETKQPGKLEVTYSNILAQAKKLGKQDIVSTYMEKLNHLRRNHGCERCFFTGELNRVFYSIEQGKHREAIALADELIAYADSMDRDESHAIYLMGVAYRGLDEYDKATALISRAFDLAGELQHNGKLAFYSHALYQTYYWKDKYGSALDWYKTHIQYRDSVYNEKKLKEIAVYDAKLSALKQKQKVAELEAKVEIDRQKKRLLWISLLLGSLFAGAVLYAQRQRAKTEQVRQKALLMQSELERNNLEQQLEFKQKELATQLLGMTQKNNLLKTVSSHISDIKTDTNAHAVSRVLRIINRGLDDSEEWDVFLKTFRSIHSSFLEQLQKLAENLTSNEIRLASLMKMNLSSKEIASLLNISDDGVKKARYRLRKKLGLDSDIHVQDYLLSL